jgi:adenosylmethionine-8-amino-7-oxononanoate aminotransferase
VVTEFTRDARSGLFRESMMNSVWRPYCQMKTAPPPMKIVATEGCHLIGENGERWIDGMASWWSACRGYKHPRVREAGTAELHDSEVLKELEDEIKSLEEEAAKLRAS